MSVLVARQGGLWRQALPAVLGCLCLYLLWQQGSRLDGRAVGAALSAITVWQWLGAGLATAASFWAIAQYDVVAHRHFDTGAEPRAARGAGAAAIALGQTLGFGPVVGAAVRWHLLPGLGHGAVLKVTGFVTATFFASWALIAASVALPQRLGFGGVGWMLLPLAVALLLTAVFLWPKVRLGSRQISMPSVRATAQMIALAGADLICAALVLWILCPPDLAPPFWYLASAFIFALGAGMIGGTPGGVGPFELALAMMLPGSDGATLAASLLAYRAVYYAAPCLIAGLYLVVTRPRHHRSAPPQAAIATGPRAEFAIVEQTTSETLSALDNRAPVLKTAQSLLLFLGAQHQSVAPLLRPLRHRARMTNRLPCLYKITARDAALARKAGWRVMAFADEAVVDLARFSLQGSARRQLRRSLRKATEAGITIARDPHPDWQALAQINAKWAAQHGGERGLTMGRFCPDYLHDKPVFVARHGAQVVAFATALDASDERSLDIMRYVHDLQPGAMHLLVAAMIEDAKARGLSRMNLAAVPHHRLPKALRGAPGLARFKQSFGPDWQTRYFAAPSAWALALTAIDIWRSIRRPEPLPVPTQAKPDATLAFAPRHGIAAE